MPCIALIYIGFINVKYCFNFKRRYFYGYEYFEMNPITHLLVSWSCVEPLKITPRDKTIVTWLGISPDLDGLGAIVDVLGPYVGLPNLELYSQYHHQLFHGIFCAILLPAIAVIFACNRLMTFLLGFLVIHLHLLCDLVGSRGLHYEDIWPIHYLFPLNHSFKLEWSGQWPLNAWPNIVLTIILLGFMFMRTITHGQSIISLFSLRAHEAFVLAVQIRWKKIRGIPKV
jgi:inner membrane protein